MSYNKKIRRMLYFRKMSREDKESALASFDNDMSEETTGGAKNVFESYRTKLRSEYQIDSLKLGLFLLPLLGILCGAISSGILLFIQGYGALSELDGVLLWVLNFVNKNASAIATYILPLLLLIFFIWGVRKGRVELREYKYHYPVTIIYLIFALGLWIYMIYTLAQSLSQIP